MKKAVRTLGLVSVMLVAASCACLPARPANVGDPRVLGDLYRGTGDIEIFQTLLWHCFDSVNAAFFKSMVLDPGVLRSEDEKFSMDASTPSSRQALRLNYSPTVSPRFSFPHLPSGAKIRGSVKAFFPEEKSDTTMKVRMTIEWPVAEYKGKLYIVMPECRKEK